MQQAEEPELPKDVLAPAEGPRENLVSVLLTLIKLASILFFPPPRYKELFYSKYIWGE